MARAGATASKRYASLIDLDRFKEVNDSGPRCRRCCCCGRWLAAFFPWSTPMVTVARLGGDEFGIIRGPSVDGAVDLDWLCFDLLTALNTPLIYNQRQVECSASLGWSSYPDQATEPSALLKNADVALYAAKSEGRSRVARFKPEMSTSSSADYRCSDTHVNALASDGIIPFYQPKMDLVSGRILGFEALLRWADQGKLRSPASIQEALDDPEWSTRLGARMLERSLADAAAWNAAGVPFGHVALNVSTAEFQGGFGGSGPRKPRADAIAIGPARDRSHRARPAGRQQRRSSAPRFASSTNWDILIALDDFGTGFAS